jgi:hypothetical protein
VDLSHDKGEPCKGSETHELQEALAPVMASVAAASSLAAMVLAVLAGVRELGRWLLAHELERRDQAFRSGLVPVLCPTSDCRAVMMRCKNLRQVGRYTLLGKVRYRRCSYRCPCCGRRMFPLDHSLSLGAALRGHSEEFGNTLVLLCTLMPFGKGCELFERLCGFAVSTRLACALTMGIGTRLHREEMELAEQLWKERAEEPEKFEPTPAVLRTMPRRKRVYVMTDNSKVGIQPGRRGRGAPKIRTLRKQIQEARRKKASAAKRHKLGPQPPPTATAAELEAAAADLADEGWRDVRALLIFDEEDLASSSKKRRQILRRRVLAHVGTKEEWIKLVHMALHEEGVYTAEEVVVIADGGSGIWELVDELLPTTNTRKVIEILDWYHAASHLWAVGRALKGCKTEPERKACAAWVRPLLDHMAEGKVANVLQRLGKIVSATASAMDTIRKCIEYFEKHRARMRYAWNRDHGRLIGSGAMESVHAWVIQPRCRLPGMRWSVEGANAILRLRCTWASGRWDEDFTRAAHQAAKESKPSNRELKLAA